MCNAEGLASSARAAGHRFTARARPARRATEVTRRVANLLGHDAGVPRAPFAEVAAGERDRLAAILRDVDAGGQAAG
jgi:hypothetical protein